MGRCLTLQVDSRGQLRILRSPADGRVRIPGRRLGLPLLSGRYVADGAVLVAREHALKIAPLKHL